MPDLLKSPHLRYVPKGTDDQRPLSETAIPLSASYVEVVLGDGTKQGHPNRVNVTCVSKEGHVNAFLHLNEFHAFPEEGKRVRVAGMSFSPEGNGSTLFTLMLSSTQAAQLRDCLNKVLSPTPGEPGNVR